MNKVNPPGYLGRQDWLWGALTNSQGSKWLKPKITPNASLGINNYDWDREDGATAQNHGAGMYIWGKEISQRNRDDKQQGFRDRVNGL